MDIGFFFNYNDTVIQLPVNPDKVTVKCSGNNSVSQIISLGEINLLKDRKLTSISFKSFFPNDVWFPAIRTSSEFAGPDYYKKFFTDIQDAKKPVRLLITGLNINMLVSIEEFEFYHQAGDHEDAYYSIELKEYREYHITPIPLAASPSVAAQATTTVSPSQITKGCNVILNGRVHYDSYGAKPGKTFSNYKGKVNFVNLKGSHPYHVTTPSGGWLGWVTKESVVLA